MSENLTSIIITIITLLFSGGAWKFYEYLIKNKRQKQKDKREEEIIYRDDLKARVEKLEKEKEDCKEELMIMSTQLAALQVEVEYIKRENERLKYR
jgi:pantothenate kinase